MTVTIKEVRTKKDLRIFIYLPEKIHAGHKNWGYPIYIDEWDFYNPLKNKFFNSCDATLLLAFRNNKPVGRIMGIINRKYNTIHNEQNGRFFALECYNDPEAAGMLLSAVEDWCLKKGMNKIIGPFGFSEKDPQGFMIEGFDMPPIIATNSSFDYMPGLMEKCSYTKEIDCVDYLFPVPKEIPEFYRSIYKRCVETNHLELKEFTTKKSLRPFIKPVFELINQTYADIYGFSALTPKEIDYFANRYLTVIDPRFVKVVYNDRNELIAFAIAMPEVSQGIIKARGRLFPFGLICILREAKRTKLLTMLLGAIRADYRNNGIDAFLGMKILESAQKLRFEWLDSHLVLENNVKMRAEYERMGGEVKKRYRIFSKAL
jgi:hypothetical protein